MKNIILLAILFAGKYVVAQNNYNGKIVSEIHLPLAGATIQSKTDTSHTAISDAEGNFSINLQNDARVIIRFIGFETIETTLSSLNNNIITLNENDEVLKEIVISASREIQMRKEVPAAITVISSKEIEAVKAFGIDQLINNVPGVFMSTSRAASNEQHFMSVRSPISTKPLFLYLEDGLPIRPTAVFNHNALLEMNDVSYNRIEVLKGPASSIYGSESIGGSFNFITKKPTRDFSGYADFQINDLGLKRYALEVSQYANDHVGFYLGAQYIQRKDGPVAYSDYEKFALTFKNVIHISPSLNSISVFDIINYRSDMTGSLSEADYSNRNYESDQTFTFRNAFSFRFRTTIDKRWNDNNKTAFNLIFRKNRLGQNPSYRVQQFRDKGQLTGFGKGEINNNSYTSYVGLIQHKTDLNFANSSLIVGSSLDYSPQDYVAETIAVTVDTETGRNVDYSINSGDYILKYNAGILNYAVYAQYEMNPIEALKLTASLRYDGFNYNYNNLVDGKAGPKDSKNSYNNVSPKVGLNYNFSRNFGLYSNYSNGFTPPETATLYRNSFVGVGGEVFDLKPSDYDNFEIGTYFKVANKLQADVAIYLLEGKNTLVTLRNENDEFFNKNAGRTRSYGVEYGIKYTPMQELTITHNGSFSNHRYIRFFENGVDYSNTDIETAPHLLGTSKISYTPNGLKGLTLHVTHELVGKYNSSFEGQIDNNDGTFGTATYKGHHIFNALASFEVKQFEVWVHALNLFNDLYSASTTYNKFRNENSYTIGNPRAFHLGVKYKF